ncbi:hypothetical protein [Pseudomonas leptonychotis]|uniref:hypothetical protein n=1 Tax=Pseudomonas leptonychotis TaxID=2448482 RepID=UPI0039F06CAE
MTWFIKMADERPKMGAVTAVLVLIFTAAPSVFAGLPTRCLSQWKTNGYLSFELGAPFLIRLVKPQFYLQA